MKVKKESVALTVLAEEETQEGRYVLAELTLWKGSGRVLYAEKGTEASFVLLSHPLVMEERELLSLVARGQLSPIQLGDVVKDAILPIP